jgi:hypothetical protein
VRTRVLIAASGGLKMNWAKPLYVSTDYGF